jgi:HEPN superfamily RiboL-PSP-like protein
MLVEIQRDLDRLNHYLRLLRESELDSWASAMICQHICVQISGALETNIRAIMSEYARKASNARVHRAVDHYCRTLQNPKATYIADLVRSFDAGWNDELEKFWSGRIKDLIDSIAANRNNIAHGRSVGVSISRLADFYGAYVDLIRFLHRLILGR